MAKRALSWKRAAAIGWRDLKSAPGKFGFVVLSVAVGVAALVGVRGLSNSFRQSLSTEARSLLAGDLSARMFHAPTAEQMGKIAAIANQSSGIRSTWTTETISMASVPPDPVPLLVSLKAVDPAEYPYYGTAVLAPAMPLQQALQGDSAVVADEFLIRLNARVGQTLRLGGRNFTITAVLKQEAGADVLTVDVRGLNASPAAFYEVWLLSPDTNGLVALGVLGPADQGTFEVPQGLDLSRYSVVDVSREPFDGNPAHSADSIVRGTLPV